MSKSLLPPNRTQFERDLEQVQCRTFDDIKMPHRDLWNPWTCPLELLPFLAWAESVDVWNDRWPEATKRAVIANSKPLHEIKGTDGAVEQALEALGVRVEVIHWYEATPRAPRGTMNLKLWINDNINPDGDTMIDSEMIRDLIDSVDRSKRKCIHYTFEMNIEMHTGMRLAYSAETLALTHMDAMHLDVTVDADVFALRQGFSAETLALTHMDAMHLDVTVDADPSVMSLGFSAETLAITYLEMTI